MVTISTKETCYYVETTEQVDLLVSPVRQEIVDSLSAMGPSSVPDIARAVGVAGDSLYYHIKKLVGAGLVVRHGQRATTRRDETLYAIPKGVLRLRYDMPEEARALIPRVVASALRTASRDFQTGLESGEATIEGSQRNLWGTRLKARLSPSQLTEVNECLDRIESIFSSVESEQDSQLCTIAWALAPVESKPLRRGGT